MVINGGKNVALVANYQPENATNTERWVMGVYDWDMNPVTLRCGNSA